MKKNVIELYYKINAWISLSTNFSEKITEEY
jgi:hypothetical protein